MFSFGARSKADVFICYIPDKHHTYGERLIFVFEMQMNTGQRNPCAVDVDWLGEACWVGGVRNELKWGHRTSDPSTHSLLITVGDQGGWGGIAVMTFVAIA